MFFTKLGKVLAILMTATGILSIVAGILVGISFYAVDEAGPSAFLASERSYPKLIDDGAILLLLGVTLGILVEISRALNECASGSGN